MRSTDGFWSLVLGGGREFLHTHFSSSTSTVRNVRLAYASGTSHLSDLSPRHVYRYRPQTKQTCVKNSVNGGGGVGVYPSMHWAGEVCIPACTGADTPWPDTPLVTRPLW